MDLTAAAAERAELDAVLNSALFRKAPNQARFLRYLCERCFERQVEQPKEHQIAIEALGRNESFDEREDSIVRVEAFRLRRRLQRYYQTEGSAHRLRISMEPGQYAVRFIEAEECATETIPEIVFEDRISPEPAAPLPARAWWRWVALLLIVVTIGVAFVTAVLQRRSRAAYESSPEPGSPLPLNQATGLTSGPAVRILAGYDRAVHLDRLAQVWGGDNWFHGGEAVTCPRQFLARTPDRTIYRHCRRGNFTYDIPLKPGTYELHLYFGPSVRPWTLMEESMRSYPINIEINGVATTVFLNFASDGATNSVPDIRVFRDVAPAADGVLHLHFSNGGSQYAFVNAIEILPGVHGRLLPIRLTAADSFYTDSHGNIWPPDRYYRGGQSAERRDEVTGTRDPDLFSSERYGNFDYLIPVAHGGSYAITLGFAETWFGPSLPAGGGAESRLFDVSCNGALLVKNLNVYKEAGGSDRALIRTFHNVHPDAADKLRLTFTSSRNNAMVNFIEIDDEATQTATR